MQPKRQCNQVLILTVKFDSTTVQMWRPIIFLHLQQSCTMRSWNAYYIRYMHISIENAFTADFVVLNEYVPALLFRYLWIAVFLGCQHWIKGAHAWIRFMCTRDAKATQNWQSSVHICGDCDANFVNKPTCILNQWKPLVRIPFRSILAPVLNNIWPGTMFKLY